jgi:16S rRNA (cytidine1402-2'-O)-methyltransferase
MQRQQSFQNNKASLYVIATPIGNLREISSRVIDALNDCEYVFCEDTRVTGQLLAHLNIKKKLVSAYENIEKQSANKVVELLKENINVAFASDAGYPGISDPGHIVIQEVIKNDFNVVVVNGPSALIQSVLASGLPTDHFYFYGFLNAKQSARIKELEELKTFKHTMIFYQSQHKVLACLTDMLEVLGDRRVCLCRELTKKFEEYIRGNISEIIPICESLKGEMVLVVEGYVEEIKESLSLKDCLPLIDKEINNGLTTKEAIKLVASQNNVNKKELYQFYHNEKGE